MKRVHRLLRCGLLAAVLLAVIPMTRASAHPLGNFTTNTALSVAVRADRAELSYAVDLAEIPALKVRREALDAPNGPVDPAKLSGWAASECGRLRSGVEFTQGGARIPLTIGTARASLVAGQAGLSTLQLACTWTAVGRVATGTELSVVDTNYADRIGWREVSLRGEGVTVRSDVPATSPTKMLTAYPSDALSTPSRVRSASGSVISLVGTPERASSSSAAQASPAGVSDRFQRLIAHDRITPGFAILAVLLAVLLGGLHALAPGHGKSLMAAYALGRSEGGRRELLTIGVTVALTHTVGVTLLGGLALATSVVSTSATLRWTGVLSGVLVVAVGARLLLDRLRDRSARRSSIGGRHAHGHHDHEHHDHGHHDHGHHSHDHRTHDHRTRTRLFGRHLDAARNNPDLVVSTHRHGGVAHAHVLPAQGAKIDRRQLIAMGLAGGLVPSPSALVVLLAGITLGRTWFGLTLVAAYGVGLALTLIMAGVLLARLEGRLRRSSFAVGGVLGSVVAMAPVASACALVGGGLIVIFRALHT